MVDEDDPTLCGGNYKCAEGTECREFWEGPNFGITNFEHGKPKIVKVGDAKVWTFPKLTSLGTFRTPIVASAKCWIVFINHYFKLWLIWKNFTTIS